MHPITILSTLPSAGVGRAARAAAVRREPLDMVALIGIILLIGIVKKNAIMMIDFALDGPALGGKAARWKSIYQACAAALPPDHDDHDGGAAGRVAAGAGAAGPHGYAIGRIAELRSSIRWAGSAAAAQPPTLTIVGGLERLRSLHPPGRHLAAGHRPLPRPALSLSLCRWRPRRRSSPTRPSCGTAAWLAGVTEITSGSTLGGCSVTIQFDLNRNVDGAARDVQAAINASAGDLPIDLPGPPTYRKDQPRRRPHHDPGDAIGHSAARAGL
jgi:hypothetical protein